MPNQLEQWFFEVPPITRTYATAIVALTVACQLELVSPYQLYFDWTLVKSGQPWRMLTTFLYFGKFSLDFMFQIYFLVRHARMTEEATFRGQTVDFAYFLLYGCVSILLVAVLTNAHVSFLSSSLNFMLIYVWARRNPTVRMNFMGIFNFTAPFLPWAFLGFSVLMNGDWPVADLLGMGVGHVYYFAQDIYPKIPGTRGVRWLDTPRWLLRLAGHPVEEEEEPVVVQPVVAGAAPPAPDPAEARGAGGQVDGDQVNPGVVDDMAPAAAPGGYAWGGAPGHALRETARRRQAAADAAAAPPGERGDVA